MTTLRLDPRRPAERRPLLVPQPAPGRAPRDDGGAQRDRPCPPPCAEGAGPLRRDARLRLRAGSGRASGALSAYRRCGQPPDLRRQPGSGGSRVRRDALRAHGGGRMAGGAALGRGGGGTPPAAGGGRQRALPRRSRRARSAPRHQGAAHGVLLPRHAPPPPHPARRRGRPGRRGVELRRAEPRKMAGRPACARMAVGRPRLACAVGRDHRCRRSDHRRAAPRARALAAHPARGARRPGALHRARPALVRPLPGCDEHAARRRCSIPGCRSRSTSSCCTHAR